MVDRKVKLVIFGSTQSKANSRRLVTFGGRPRFIKSKAALQFEKDIKAQVQPLKQMLEGDLSFHADIYYPSRRQDLDPSILLDALQGLIYANDRQFKQISSCRFLDKQNLVQRSGLKRLSMTKMAHPSCWSEMGRPFATKEPTCDES